MKFTLLFRVRGPFGIMDNERRSKPGDFLFIPAGNEHRFENITDDFVT